MHRDTQDGEYYQSQASVKKDVSEREETNYIDPDKESDSKKNNAG
jgi:hypothetical protein